MVEAYTKSPLTFEQQLQQLKNRGLIIENDGFALSQLRTISYYRLSAYWYPFRKIEQGGTIADDFEEGTHFDEVMTLYEFDRRLRLLVMDAIERVEVCVRTLFAYQVGHKYGTFGHNEAANFHPGFDHAPWLEKLEDETSRSRDVFIIVQAALIYQRAGPHNPLPRNGDRRRTRTHDGEAYSYSNYSPPLVLPALLVVRHSCEGRNDEQGGE